MLKELNATHHAEEPPRRWFADDDVDLIVWIAEDSTISGFQLCYDRQRSEHALTWTTTGGYSHTRIDDGEADPTKNQSPILLADGVFAAADVLRRFEASSRAIDPKISGFVAAKLRQYAATATTASPAASAAARPARP